MPHCIICHHHGLTLKTSFHNLLQVTSDSRIWKAGGSLAICPACHTVQKPITPEFLEETKEIYASYQLYFQADGKEQKIFHNGEGLPRSELLLRHMFDHHHFPETCDVLDVGCGVGNLLQALHRHRPCWTLYGADINDNRREQILSIGGVRDFFNTDLAAIDKKFDLIFLSHVLEHVPEPATFVQKLRQLLADNGKLVILVPYWKHNAFDLLVADHCIHFCHDALRYLLNSQGMEALALRDDLLPKELYVLAKPGHSTALTLPTPRDNAPRLKNMLLWLNDTRNWAQKAPRQQPTIGVFGTALAATWLVHAAKLSPAFFVDEDPDRQGRSYLGSPILSPSMVPHDAKVLIPLLPPVANHIADRLNQQKTTPVFIAPPTGSLDTAAA